MTALYLLCPGPVRSRTDGDWHHIGARQLAHLYRVPMDECVELNHGGSPYLARQRDELLARVYRGELIALKPRADGDYRMPAPTTPMTTPTRTPAPVNGCHNRPPYKPVVELRDLDGRLVTAFPFRMRQDCAYTHTDLGQADPRCRGCSWRVDLAAAPDLTQTPAKP